MQMITWSPNLHSTVKKAKALYVDNNNTYLSDNNLIGTFYITPFEEKLMVQTFKNEKIEPLAYVWT
jgi:hypothetical protein